MENLIEKIADQALDLLENYAGAKDETLWMDKPGQTIGIDLTDADEEVTRDQAKEYFRIWAKKSLEKFGIVFIYACSDNALVTIESDLENFTDEEKELFDSPSDPELVPHVFIGYD